MDQITQLKRRTTDLFQSLPQSLPQLPHIQALSSYSKPGSHDAHKTMKGTWQRIAIPALPRSSHSIDVVAGTAYVFGGESAGARKPADNAMHAIVLPTGSAPADYYATKAVAAKPDPVTPIPVPIIQEPTSESESDPVAILEPETVETDDDDDGQGGKGRIDKGKGKEELVEEIPLPGPALGSLPEPRVGHATAVIGNRIFLFGGRGGPAMTPLDERGRVWVFDTKAHTWSFLDPLAPAVPPPLQAVPEAGEAATVPLSAGPGDATTAARPIFPAARSYHAAVAWDQPASLDDPAGRPLRRATSWKEWVEGDSAEVGTPQRPIVGNIAARARDVDSDGFGTFFVHGGCLADGRRTNDLWAFDVRTRVWQELPSAPGLPRGGTALCLSGSRLYRFGGFNGSSEEGGRLDYLTLGLSSLNDTSAELAEITVVAKGDWQSLVSDTVAAVESSRGKEEAVKAAAAAAAATAAAETSSATDAVNTAESTEYRGASAVAAAKPAPTILVSGPEEVWPGARSVASLEAVSAGGGWEYLLLALGERSPSGAGHEAAGLFWDDVWAFQVPSDRFSAAGVSDAVASAVHNVRSKLPRSWFGSLNGGGLQQGEGRWARLETAPYDVDEAQAANYDGEDTYGPGPRGWGASAPLRELEENAIVIFGGLNDVNQRLGDAWILRLGGETIGQS